MLGYFEMLSPKTPPPGGWGRGVKMYRFFSAVHEISRTFEMLTPKTPYPRVGWGEFFIDLLDSL